MSEKGYGIAGIFTAVVYIDQHFYCKADGRIFHKILLAQNFAPPISAPTCCRHLHELALSPTSKQDLNKVIVQAKIRSVLMSDANQNMHSTWKISARTKQK